MTCVRAIVEASVSVPYVPFLSDSIDGRCHEAGIHDTAVLGSLAGEG